MDSLRKTGKQQKSPKKSLIIFLLILIIGGALTFYLSTRHYQIRYVTHRYTYYEESGDFGSAWNMLHSLMKSKVNQATYVQTKSQIYLNDFKATAYHYKIKRIRHLNTWYLTKKNPVHNVYRVTIDESFNSQFGRKIMIYNIYFARDSKDRNRWCVLWQLSG